MCIIVAKPKGIEIPAREILRNCFNNNKNGAGIMFNHNNRVYIYKGFMSLDSFYNMMDILEDKYDLKNKGVVFHFRISTSGLIDEGNCHPYPISDDEKRLRKTKVIVHDVAMAHNGIISLCNGQGRLLNDTQLFIKDIVTPIYELNKEFYLNKKIMNMLEKLANSKLCFLDKKGDIHLLGDFVNVDGIYYSNNSYKLFGRTINNDTHIKDKVAIFDELYFEIEEEKQCGSFTTNEFDNFMKKVILLEDGEFVFNSTKEVIYEVEDFQNDLGYDDDMNLYEINQKEKTASLIEVGIEF